METKKKTMYVQPKAEVYELKGEEMMAPASQEEGARLYESYFDDDND